MKSLLLLILLVGMGLPIKLRLESDVSRDYGVAEPLSLGLRESIGQSGFAAVLGGFRSVLSDLLFIDAHAAWERTDWRALLLRLRQTTELQPHVTLFWDIAGWHMAWNASIAASED